MSSCNAIGDRLLACRSWQTENTYNRVSQNKWNDTGNTAWAAARGKTSSKHICMVASHLTADVLSGARSFRSMRVLSGLTQPSFPRAILQNDNILMQKPSRLKPARLHLRATKVSEWRSGSVASDGRCLRGTKRNHDKHGTGIWMIQLRLARHSDKGSIGLQQAC